MRIDDGIEAAPEGLVPLRQAVEDQESDEVPRLRAGAQAPDEEEGIEVIFGKKKRSATGWPKRENPLVEAVRKAKWRYMRPDGTPLYRPPPELEWDEKKGRMVIKDDRR